MCPFPSMHIAMAKDFPPGAAQVSMTKLPAFGAAFQKRLESHGLTATVRRSLGGDIDASCGQLRRKEMEAKERGR